MLPYFWYMLKVIICSGILFGYYWFFLRNKIFHQYNRFYLLASIALSLLLPLLKINFWQPATQQNQAIRVLRAVSVGDEYMNNIVITAHKNNWSFEQLYTTFYWLVCIIFFFVMIRTLFLIRTLLKKYPVQQIEQVSFINTNHSSTPFSFLKYIFWNSSIDIDTATGRQIFKHEVAHIQQKHTHDKLFVNIILIFCWCNPFFWLYRKELNMIHEFIADKKAVEDSDTAVFAAMILQAAYPGHQFQIANNFFYSPIKRRLLMLSKNKNPKVNYIGRIMVLPLLVLVFAAFTLKTKSNNSIYHGKKITVVIDAGHGGQDLGASSANGIFEKDLTLAIAKKIKELNSNDAVEIILVRDEDVYMNPQQKVEFAKSKNADLFISFHIDNGPKQSANKHTGISFWVAKDEFANAGQSKVLASAIVTEFGSNYGLPVIYEINQRQGSIWILQANSCPAVLIEAGFINNDKDLAYLQTASAKETIAKNVLAAIEKFAISRAVNKTQNKISNADTTPYSIYVNVKHADSNYLKTDEFKTKALVIVDSREVGNVGNNYIEKGGGKYSTIVVYNPSEARKIYGEKGRFGVIKLTLKEASFTTVTADSIFFDESTKTIKLTGANTNLKGDFSDALIYVDGKIASPTELIAIPSGKISSVKILQGEKLDDIIDAKGKKIVINVSLKPDDLAEVVVTGYRSNKETPVVAIALDKMNALYIGVDNPVTIAVTGITSDKLLVNISNGNSITGSNGKYNAHVTAVGEATIVVSTIKNNERVILSTQTFKVKRIPDPVNGNVPIDNDIKLNLEPKMYLGNNTGGKISLEYLKTIKEISVTPGYTLLNASMYFQGPGFPDRVVQITLSSAPLASAQSAFNKCENGASIIFDNIQVKDKNGVPQTLQSPPGYIVYDKKTETPNASITQTVSDEKVFTQVEQNPQFTGGQEAWKKYLRANLKVNTPVDNGAKAGTYKVVLKFIVNTDGSLSDIKCENDPGFGICAEAIRFIKTTPKWQPAVQNGKKVNAYLKQPITFVVEDAEGTSKIEIYKVPLKVHMMNENEVKTYNMVGNGEFAVSPGVLYYLNGKVTDDPKSILKIDVLYMESYDPGSGKKYFGEKGKNGVLILKTKS